MSRVEATCAEEEYRELPVPVPIERPSPSVRWIHREIEIAFEGAAEMPTIEDDVSGNNADIPFSSEAVVVAATNSVVTRTATSSTENCRGMGGMDWIGRCTLLMSILIIAGSMGLGVLLVGSSKSRRDSINFTSKNKHRPVLSPTQYYDLLYQHLLNVRQVQDLHDPSTPTYEALEWMAFQDGTVLQLLVGKDDDKQQQQRQQQPPQRQWQLDVPRMEQRFGLAVFYFSTAGAEFWNAEWLQVGTHECEYDGVTCREEEEEEEEEKDSSTGTSRSRQLVVTSLELHQRSLLGAIPQELAWLTQLEVLDLHLNRLQGTLPVALFQDLSKLQYLDVAFNELTGSLPNDWSAMTSLQDMAAQSNSLTGSLPKLLPILSLEYLSLNLNAFTGTIPLTEWNAQARLFDELLSLNLDSSEGDSYDGAWAAENLTHGSVALKLLDLGDTDVGGTFPSLIGVTLSKLVSLGLYQTNIKGTIPSQFGQLVMLEELSLGSTQFTGPAPMEIWGLSKLQWLVLSSTAVSGTFPPQVSNLSSLQVLNVMGTKWLGTLPSELGTLSQLEWLQLSDTAIYGSVPSQLGQLSKLKGSFPSEVCNLPFIHEDLRVDCSGIQCSCCDYCF